MKTFYAGWEAQTVWFENPPKDRPSFDFVYFPEKPTTWNDPKTYTCKGMIESESLDNLYALLKHLFGPKIIVNFTRERNPDLDAHYARTRKEAGAVQFVCENEIT